MNPWELMNIDKSWELMNREVTCDDLLHINVYNLPGKVLQLAVFPIVRGAHRRSGPNQSTRPANVCVCPTPIMGCLIYISNSYGMDQNRDYFEVDFTTIFLMFGHSPSSNTIENH